jgi:hypothetical protein
MSVTDAQLRARNLRTLAALAALFLLPLVIAFWAYYGSTWRPTALVNHGDLIEPVRPLPAITLPSAGDNPAASDRPGAGKLMAQGDPQLRSRWTLVYIGSGQCDASCQHTLYVMRQTRLALNNEMARVARVFLVTGDCCASQFLNAEHAGLQLLDAGGASAAPLLAQFPANDREHTLFIVDPLGNLMMRYDARRDPRGLLQDLKKLLSLSHIG